MSEPPIWLCRKDAASYLTSIGCPISPATLEKLASNDNAGGGPPFNRYRWRTVRYNRDDLTEWAKHQSVRVE